MTVVIPPPPPSNVVIPPPPVNQDVFIPPPPPANNAPANNAVVVPPPPVTKTRAFTFDIESYVNYFLITFVEFDIDTFEAIGISEIELYNGRYYVNDVECSFDESRNAIGAVIQSGRHFSFNGDKYDVLMLTAFLNNYSTIMLKKLGNRIINDRLMPWVFEREYGIRLLKFDHVDLIELCEGMHSLKMYGARLRAKKLQELPIDHRAWITNNWRQNLREYCINDNIVTKLIVKDKTAAIALRDVMSEQHDSDLRSKSDAQIGEFVVARMAKVMGNVTLKKPNMKKIPREFKYAPPEFLKFESEQLNTVLSTILDTTFVINSKNKVTLPKQVSQVITIAGVGYKLGIGGIHSVTSGQTYIADDDYVIFEIDVSSYYPNIILNCGFHVPAIGPQNFHKIYKSLVDIKNNGSAELSQLNSDVENGKYSDAQLVGVKKKMADLKSDIQSVKIILNGLYGKLGSHYSKVFAPNMMINTTLTGQLGILMLIEQFDKYNVEVISANTDGINVRVHKKQVDHVNELVKHWCDVTKWVMDYNHYDTIHYRDVNNYFYTQNGKAKGIGIFAGDGIKKSPANNIVRDAIFEFATKGTPIPDTVHACTDPFAFLTVKKATGGAMKDGEPIGGVVRWYRSTATQTAIHCVKPNASGTHNQVAGSERSMPLMDVVEGVVPPDCDRDWYVHEAIRTMTQVGMFKDRSNIGKAIVGIELGQPDDPDFFAKFCEEFGVTKKMIKDYKIEMT